MAEWRHRVRQPRTWVVAGLLVFCVVLITWFSRALAPVAAACVIAYLLDGVVVRLERLRVHRILGTILVMLGAVALTFLVLFSILPTIADQLNALANQVPGMVSSVRAWIVGLADSYPQFGLERETIERFLTRQEVELDNQLGRLIGILLAWAGGTLGSLVNAVIVAFLVFFILKDKEPVWGYLRHLVPYLGHSMTKSILVDIDRQMGRFIKGKFIVVFLLFLLSTAVVAAIGLEFFLLMGILTGISTFIPYVGAIVVAVPVVASGLLQWGTWGGFIGTLIAYLAIQAVDANYLTPVIIGRETNIHPVGIIMAILVFGTLWGFWGVFFAVPIAVVLKSVLDQVYFPAREGTLGEPADVKDGEAEAAGPSGAV